MDAAGYAAQSDPDCNPHFRRRWTEPETPPWQKPESACKTLENLSADVVIAWRRKAPQRIA